MPNNILTITINATKNKVQTRHINRSTHFIAVILNYCWLSSIIVVLRSLEIFFVVWRVRLVTLSKCQNKQVENCKIFLILNLRAGQRWPVEMVLMMMMEGRVSLHDKTLPRQHLNTWRKRNFQHNSEQFLQSSDKWETSVRRVRIILSWY